MSAFVTAAVPLLAACGGGTGGGAAGGQGSTVNMSDSLKYDPETLTIPKGATVTWKNTSAVTHTATDDPSKAQNMANAVLPTGAKPWDSGDIDPGKSWSYTFDTPGQYTYFCIPHEASGMVGHITVSG
jgi:plastocyanin